MTTTMMRAARKVKPAEPCGCADPEFHRMWRMIIQSEVLKLARRGVRIRRELLWWASRPEGWTE